MATGSLEFVGIAEGIRNHELSVKRKIEQLRGHLYELSKRNSSLQIDIAHLEAEIASARSQIDQNGEPNHQLIASLEAQRSIALSELAQVESDIVCTNNELEQSRKELDNVLEYKDGMSYLGFSGSWYNLVASGEGVSKGLEFLAQKTEGRATGWIAYTLSKSDREFDRNSGVNDGKKFPFTYDRRHNVNIVSAFKINDRVDIDLSWTFYSGACATVTQSKMEIISPEDVDYTYYTEYGVHGGYWSHDNASYVPSRNNYRLPCSHVLCAGISFHKQKTRCERIWNFSFYNLYNAMNPSFVYLKNYDDFGHEIENPSFKKITILPLIPSFTLTYKF